MGLGETLQAQLALQIRQQRSVPLEIVSQEAKPELRTIPEGSKMPGGPAMLGFAVPVIQGEQLFTLSNPAAGKPLGPVESVEFKEPKKIVNGYSVLITSKDRDGKTLDEYSLLYDQHGIPRKLVTLRSDGRLLPERPERHFVREAAINAQFLPRQAANGEGSRTAGAPSQFAIEILDAQTNKQRFSFRNSLLPEVGFVAAMKISPPMKIEETPFVQIASYNARGALIDKSFVLYDKAGRPDKLVQTVINTFLQDEPLITSLSK